MPYSQNNEEVVLLEHLATLADGSYAKRFLDVGAYNPKIFSNTRVLVERGWTGVYVEPAPSNFDLFLKEYRENPSITLVNAAVSPTAGLVTFYDSDGDALSTTKEEHVAKWRSYGTKFRAYWTSAITWDALIAAVGCDFSVLSLDVESANWELFSCLPLALFPELKVIIVEHDGAISQMVELAEKHSFKYLTHNGENLILTR